MMLENQSTVREENFVLDTFREWVILTARSFQDEMGLENGLDILDPYSKNAGIAVNNNWKKFVPDLNGIDGAAKIFHLTMKYMGIDNRSYLNRLGFYTKVKDCPYGAGPQVICYMHMWQCAHHMLVNLGVDYDTYLLKKLTTGDAVCLNVVTEEKEPANVLVADDTIEISYDPVPPMEQQRLYRLWATDLWEYFMMAYSDQVGTERCIEVLTPKFLSAGSDSLDRLFGESVKERASVSAVEVLEMLTTRFGMVTKLDGRIEDGLEIKITECPFSRSRKDMCELIHVYLEGAIGNVDGECSISCPKMVTDGADHCLMVLKTSKKTEDSKPTMEGVVMQLKIRLAKGEISKKEYEELYELLNR